MDTTELLARLEEAAPGVVVEPASSVDLHTTICVGAEDVVTVARVLRDGPGLRFAVLADLVAVDFFPREPRFELVYILVSIEHRRRLRLKVRLHGSGPTWRR